ncbi:MAG TPA: hypothetical protein VME18_09155 [Acidobacteriaceae bacterium]|nr:hypothetical protein [Acidobacteriaceae bacterium]
MAIQASSRVPSAAANGKHGHSLISDAKFRQLYELTLRLRLEVRRANGHGQGLAGREAALAAVSSDLRAGDALVTDQPIPGGIHLAETAAPFAERVIAAIARATADRLRKNARVTAIFSAGADFLHEAHALASAARLPILFVEDAPAAPKSSRPRSRSHSAPHSNVLTSIPVDAQDVVALYRVAHESIVRAREGSGPTRILCTPWPASGGQAEDSVDHLEHWLQARGLPAQDWRREILAAAEPASSARDEKVFTEVL